MNTIVRIYCNPLKSIKDFLTSHYDFFREREMWIIWSLLIFQDTENLFTYTILENTMRCLSHKRTLNFSLSLKWKHHRLRNETIFFTIKNIWEDNGLGNHDTWCDKIESCIMSKAKGFTRGLWRNFLMEHYGLTFE